MPTRRAVVLCDPHVERNDGMDPPSRPGFPAPVAAASGSGGTVPVPRRRRLLSVRARRGARRVPEFLSRARTRGAFVRILPSSSGRNGRTARARCGRVGKVDDAVTSSLEFGVHVRSLAGCREIGMDGTDDTKGVRWTQFLDFRFERARHGCIMPRKGSTRPQLRPNTAEGTALPFGRLRPTCTMESLCFRGGKRARWDCIRGSGGPFRQAHPDCSSVLFFPHKLLHPKRITVASIPLNC